MAATDSHKLAQGSDAQGVRHKPSKPWESILGPYLETIVEMRSGRHPIPYRKISIELKHKYGLEIAFSTVASFVRARSKKRKVNEIHPSFLQKPPPAALAKDSAVERLRKKKVTPLPPNDDWKDLHVQGPLIKE